MQFQVVRLQPFRPVFSKLNYKTRQKSSNAAKRAERQEQSQESNEAQEASSRSAEQAQNEARQANPNQRVGGNVDVSV